jgi:signal transduction histidine kinase
MPQILSIFPADIPDLVCAILAVALSHAWWGRRMALIEVSAQRAAMQDLVRLVRLTAGDLRGTALALLGRAQISAEPERAFLLSTQASLLDLTEALLRQTEAPDPKHHLREEAVRLRPMLDFAVSQVMCQLGQSRRGWRVADDLHGMEVLADRRAVHQVLLRVLTSAALATRDGDWITVTGGWSADVPEGGWTLTVEDEGAGLQLGATPGEGRDTRGLGVGLTLASSLMQAHGGALTVKSAASIGTRVGIAFPACRVIAGHP